MTRIKVCGDKLIRRTRSAPCGSEPRRSVSFSTRKARGSLRPRDAREIIRFLPPFITKVGVFVNADADYLREARDVAGFDIYQFHGDETPQFCASFGGNYIKAIG